MMLLVMIVLSQIFLAVPAFAQDVGSATTPASEKTEDTGWKSRLKLSYINTSGNTENETFATSFDLRRKNENRFVFNVNSIVQNSNGRETANQVKASGRWERTIKERLFLLVTSSYERDRFSGYEYRASLGPGIGYDLFTTEAFELKVYGAAVYYYDKFDEGPLDLNNYLGLDTSVETTVRPGEDVELNNSFQFLTSTEDTANYFAINETAANVKVVKFISLGVTYRVRYDNQPPVPSLDKVNTTFLTSLIFNW